MADKRFLAVCVMTYKHPDTVDTVLGYWVQLIKELGFDIYYYDSSPDDETEKIVKKYQQESEHIFYIRIPSEMSPDDKFLLPYDSKNLPYEYSYLWPVKDRMVPDLAMTVNIYQRLLIGCDFLLVTPHYYDDIYLADNEPELGMSAEEFYRDYAWAATDLVSGIYNYNTLLERFNVNEIKERYFFNGQCSFPHTAVIFHYLALMKKPAIYVIHTGKHTNTIFSAESISGWRKGSIGIDIFGNFWPRLNYAFPDVYDKYKKEAIRRETNLNVLFGSVDGLISLHFADPDSHKYSDPMLSHWEDFSDVPVEIARDISNGSFDSAYDNFTNKFDACVKSEDNKALAMLCHTNMWIKYYTSFFDDSRNANIFDASLAYYDETTGAQKAL